MSGMFVRRLVEEFGISRKTKQKVLFGRGGAGGRVDAPPATPAGNRTLVGDDLFGETHTARLIFQMRSIGLANAARRGPFTAFRHLRAWTVTGFIVRLFIEWP